MQSDKATVDPAEVARFERVAEDWWNPRGAMRALHKLNPARLAWIARACATHLEQAANPLAGLAVLDIGCGGGILSESLARAGARVTGIDPAARNLEVARRHAQAGRLDIDYRITTAEALAATGARFDVVCALEVIEHVADVGAFLAAASTLTRPGGLCFVATLNRTFRSFALAVVGAEYVLRWVPKGTHQWEKFITPRELEEALETAGLDPVARTGLVYDPFRDAWGESRDMAINYMMAAAKPA
jgi:2-polyprenyl-6-hydroxyphenyl methylase/3-demethylubiquinone-9 3-methyltransferase